MFRHVNLEALKAARTATEPYPFLVAQDALNKETTPAIAADFPEIKVPGFFNAEELKIEGAFAEFLDEIRSREVSAVVSEKLGFNLTDRPKMITIRKLSAAKDGRIHTDGPSKLATMLFYFNDAWNKDNHAGCLRVLRGPNDFDDMVEEISPVVGSVFAFKRTDSSWHGHKPFVGERRVVQMTWLQSEEDVARKAQRGRVSHFLKKILGG